MFTLIIVLISVIAVLMTLAVLLQAGTGGGLAGIASGGATTQILGSRQAPDFLEKATWVLSTAFIVLCILSNFVIDRTGNQGSVIQEQGVQTQQQAPILPPAGEQLDGGAEGAAGAGTGQEGGGTDSGSGDN